MYGWRETTDNVAVPPNCVIYDRTRLNTEFGPTLVQFVSTLELSQTRFGSASTRVEGTEGGQRMKPIEEEEGPYFIE